MTDNHEMLNRKKGSHFKQKMIHYARAAEFSNYHPCGIRLLRKAIQLTANGTMSPHRLQWLINLKALGRKG